MTDRFYPIPAAAEPAPVMPGMASRNIGDFHKALYKTSYTSQNQMATFPRSAFPPGYAGHQPGIRDKFGYGSPGPETGVLARPESSPGLKSVEQTKADDGLDSLWPPSPEGTGGKSGGGLIEGSLPAPAVSRQSKNAAQASKGFTGPLEDAENKYFIPDTMKSDWSEARVLKHKSSLSKMEKMMPITGGFGTGTGFNCQKPGVNWWPVENKPDMGMSVYSDTYTLQPYHPKSGFDLTAR